MIEVLSAISCSKRSPNRIIAENVGTLPPLLESPFTILVHVTHHLPFISTYSCFGENPGQDRWSAWKCTSPAHCSPMALTLWLTDGCRSISLYCFLQDQAKATSGTCPRRILPYLTYHLSLCCCPTPSRSPGYASITKPLHRNTTLGACLWATQPKRGQRMAMRMIYKVLDHIPNFIFKHSAPLHPLHGFSDSTPEEPRGPQGTMNVHASLLSV